MQRRHTHRRPIKSTHITINVKSLKVKNKAKSSDASASIASDIAPAPFDIELLYDEAYKKLDENRKKISDRPLQQKIADILFEASQLKKEPEHNTDELLKVISRVDKTLASWQAVNDNPTDNTAKTDHAKNVQKLHVLANKVKGKSSLAWQALGSLMIGLAILFILSAITLVLISGVGIIPCLSATLLSAIGLFGFAPAIVGIGGAKFGYDTFKFGSQKGLAKRVGLFAKAVTTGSETASVKKADRESFAKTA